MTGAASSAARVPVPEDDQAAGRDLLGQHAVALDHGARDRLEQGPHPLEYLLGLARRHSVTPS